MKKLALAAAPAFTGAPSAQRWSLPATLSGALRPAALRRGGTAAWLRSRGRDFLLQTASYG